MSVGAPPTGSPQAMTTPGSLTSLMNGLVALQATLPNAPALAGVPYALSLSRWRPNQADLPGLWNWILPSSSEMRDLSRIRDTVNISTQIGIAFSDVEDRMGFVESVADAYRGLVDAQFWNGSTQPPATKGYTTWAARTQMQSFSSDIGGVPVVGIEFIQSFYLDRRLA
jgi:hypothetical protein